MAVHIRLRRMGKKKRPFYRIVAADSRRARDGRFLEVLGTYDPITKPARLKLFEERIGKWLDEGAVPSDTVRTLFTQVGFTEKFQKMKKGDDVSAVELKTEITERRKKTRKMKKAAVAKSEAEAAPAKEETPPAKEEGPPAKEEAPKAKEETPKAEAKADEKKEEAAPEKTKEEGKE